MLAIKIFMERSDGVLTSACSSNYLYHKIGTNKRRKGWGPIATFDNLEHAKASGFYGKYYLCSIKKSKEKYLWMPGSIKVDPTIIYPSTIFADSVKLLYLLHTEEKEKSCQS